jgi:predicted nucleic-acid-binding Zn-ribbon protein
MKTQQMLKKYQIILSGILKCNPEEIKFFINKEEIKEIEYFEPEKDNQGNETGVQIRYTRWNNWSEGSYRVELKKKIISTFELYKMPHCCAILVSCKALVYTEFRNKKIGTIMNSFRQDIARILGYSSLFCTDIESNTYQRQLLKTNGWKDIYSVVNKRTNNRVYLSIINL